MAVADLPPRAMAPFQEVRPCYEFAGDSSRDLLSQFDCVVIQWQNRPSFSVEPKGDLNSIKHVPFRRVGTIKVRFKKPRRMKPRVVDVEEFEPE